MSKEIAPTQNSLVFDVQVPGYQNKTTAVVDIPLNSPRIGPMVLLFIGLALALGGVAFAIMMQNAASLLSLPLALGLIYESYSQKATELSKTQRQEIAKIAIREKLKRIERAHRGYPPFARIDSKEAVEDALRDLTIPTKLRKYKAVAVHGGLSASQKKDAYVVKTSRNNVRVVSAELVPDDQYWLEGFRKAMTLK